MAERQRRFLSVPWERLPALSGGFAGGLAFHVCAFAWSWRSATTAALYADPTLNDDVRLTLLYAHLMAALWLGAAGAVWSLPAALGPPPNRFAGGFASAFAGLASVTILGAAIAPSMYTAVPAWSTLETAIDMARVNPWWSAAPLAPVWGVWVRRFAHRRAFAGFAALAAVPMLFGWLMLWRSGAPPSIAAHDKPDVLIVAVAGLDSRLLHAVEEADVDIAEFLEASALFEEIYAPASDDADAVASMLSGRMPWESISSPPGTPADLPIAMALAGYSTALFTDSVRLGGSSAAQSFHEVRRPEMRRSWIAVNTALMSCFDVPAWWASDIARTAWRARLPHPTRGGASDIAAEVATHLASPAFEPRFVVAAMTGDDPGAMLAEAAGVISFVRSQPAGRSAVIALVGLPGPASRDAATPIPRVPLALRSPGANPGERNFTMASLADAAPTLAACAGRPFGDERDEFDLRAVARGEKPGRDWVMAIAGPDPAQWPVESHPWIDARRQWGWAEPEGLLVERPSARRMRTLAGVRFAFDGRYKLVARPGPREVTWSLFDTLYDPDEENDLARRNRGAATRMRHRMIEDWTAAGFYVESRGYVLAVEPAEPRS